MVVKSCKFLKIFSHQQDNVHKKPRILRRIQGTHTSFRSRTLQTGLFGSHCKSFR